MAHILVIGGGLAGSATALFCARRGHRVTVLEGGDPPPAGAAADDDWHDWERREVPHARQGHAFLGLSTRVLREELPELPAALAARGARVTPLEPGSEDATVLSRRLVYEGVIRRAAAAEPGITLVTGARVTALLTGAEDAGITRVTGVRTQDGTEHTGDLVVDASGRRTPLARWLAEAGLGTPRETAQPCGFFYLTRHYRLRPGHAFPSTTVPIVTELDYATTLVFPGDNGTFQLSTTVAVDDPHKHRLREPEVFTRFLQAVPSTARWCERGVPLDEPAPMGRLENRRRTLLGADGTPVAAGLVMVGDAALQTNPTFGRGVSLAFAHARRLAQTAEQAAAGPAAYTERFERWTDDTLGVWFEIQRATDQARLAQLRAGLRGEHAPPPDDLPNRFVRAMAVLRDDDEHIRSASLRMYHMLMTPQDLMGDRAGSRRILAFLREHPLPETPAEGPDRAAFEALVTGAATPSVLPCAGTPADGPGHRART
ncbi:FAD-dependent oxidoreductase [Streptomyces sp. NPDC047017]|uniref:NAD(P)/FAD-dependent oxidoreductase n=1 Tax=Streptomyces sp. NPDC047017 TaxID=3155024 RepID=UPI0033E60523